MPALEQYAADIPCVAAAARHEVSSPGTIANTTGRLRNGKGSQKKVEHFEVYSVAKLN